MFSLRNLALTTLAILTTQVSFAQSETTLAISSIKLNAKTKTAKVCAPGKVLTGGKAFAAGDKPGYVIIFKNLDASAVPAAEFSDDKMVCVTGKYKIDSKGFAPHIIVDSPQAILPKSDIEKLKSLEAELAQKWNDNNISTGTTLLDLAQLQWIPTEAGLTALSQSTFRDYMSKQSDVKLADDQVLKTKVGAFHKMNIDFAVEVLALGYAYAPENSDSRVELKSEVTALIKLLGKTDKILTAVTATKVDDLDYYTVMFVNKETLQAITIFVVEGTM